MLKGITIELVKKTQTGTDAFNHPVYTDSMVKVKNVLVAPTTTTDIVGDIDLTGKKLVYTLAIPKGDKHEWKDCTVRFYGKTFKSFGYPVEGIEALVPTKWHKKVYVELYE